MQTNPYEDDSQLGWIPQTNRLNEAGYAPARPSHQSADSSGQVTGVIQGTPVQSSPSTPTTQQV